MSHKDNAALNAQVKRLVDRFLQTAEGEPHPVMLDALLTFYIVAAETHTCCTAVAARACQHAADRLKAAAADSAAGHAVH